MKRFLTILICLVLMLSIMPMEALALNSSEISNLEKYFRKSDVNVDYMLSNGIDSLKAQLLSNYPSSYDDNEVPLVFLSGNKWVKRKLIVGEHSIDHD